MRPRKDPPARPCPRTPRDTFNGAAAVRPRKARHILHLSTKNHGLQWGRGGEAAERDLGEGVGRDSTAFNGAVAVRPRKPPSRRSSRVRGTPTFNGAAAVRPRKDVSGYDEPLIEHSFNGAAAVRPRKGCRSPKRSRRPGAFNGAAAVRPRKEERPARRCWSAPSLQWGRGGEAAERPDDRPVILPIPDLQWGRGGEAAESGGGRGPRSGNALLQWGRGGEAAERESPQSPRPVGRAFNGAAAVRPRKANRVQLSLTSSANLQWGRGGEAAERDWQHRCQRCPLCPSMGPRR